MSKCSHCGGGFDCNYCDKTSRSPEIDRSPSQPEKPSQSEIADKLTQSPTSTCTLARSIRDAINNYQKYTGWKVDSVEVVDTGFRNGRPEPVQINVRSYPNMSQPGCILMSFVDIQQAIKRQPTDNVISLQRWIKEYLQAIISAC